MIRRLRDYYRQFEELSPEEVARYRLLASDVIFLCRPEPA